MNKYLYCFFIFCFTFSNSIYAWAGSVWQNLALALFVIMALLKGVRKSEFSIVYFVCCCLLSIIVNDIPAFFKPFERMIQYLLLLLAVSPLLRSYSIDCIRIKLMEILILSLGIITLASLGLYLTGGGFASVGYFGYAQHPNFLGFFAMLTTISLFALFFLSDKKMYRFIVGGMFIASLLVTMLSAARICLAGSVLGCLVFAYFKYRDSFSKLMVALAFMAGIAAATFPLYEPYLEGILYKQNAAKEENSSTSSRDLLWKTRLEEISRYPILGVGCFSVDTSIESDDINYYNPYSPVLGTVELGSTYLGVMSQTGILGFIGFAVILLLAFIHCWRTMKETDSIIPIWLLALFAALSIHMIVEGYATHSGSMQCVFLWLLISCMMLPADIMEDEEESIVQTLRLADEEDDEEDDEKDD